MPSGGQIPGTSPGLRLQANFPGVVDVGNANVSGTLTSHRGNFVGEHGGGFFDMGPYFPTSPYTSDPGNIPVCIGDKAVINWLGPGNNLIYGAVVIGSAATSQQSNGNIQVGPIAIGANAQVWTTGGVCIGTNSIMGGPADNGNVGGTVIGSSSAIYNYGGFSSGPGICIGGGVTQTATASTTHGSRNSVLIGAYIHETRDIDPGYALGGNIVIGAPTGGQYLVTSVVNSILIGTNVESGFTTTTWAGVPDSNSIQIGGTSHTKIKLGGRDITNVGATRTVADVAATATNQDGTIIYSSISAARIVTLPAANTCPAGFRLLVLDQSGSASGVNTITLTRAGADTVNGGTTVVINTAYGFREVVTDGVSKWTQIR
jgi:hypothetical protein